MDLLMAMLMILLSLFSIPTGALIDEADRPVAEVYDDEADVDDEADMDHEAEPFQVTENRYVAKKIDGQGRDRKENIRIIIGDAKSDTLERYISNDIVKDVDQAVLQEAYIAAENKGGLPSLNHEYFLETGIFKEFVEADMTELTVQDLFTAGFLDFDIEQNTMSGLLGALDAAGYVVYPED